MCLDYNNTQKFIFLLVESGEKIGTNQYRNKDTYKLHGVNATKTSYMEHTWKYKFQSGLGIDREIKESILRELRGNQVKKKRRHTPGRGNSICKGPVAPTSRHRVAT